MRSWCLAIVALVIAAPLAHADVDDGLPPHPPRAVHHTAGPWIMFGSGMTLFFASAVTEVLAHATEGYGSIMCAPHCAQPALTVAFQDGGWIGMAIGGSLSITGVVWHFLEPTATVSISPTVGGATLRVKF